MAEGRTSFNDTIIADFRAHGGETTQGPFVGHTLLLLTTTGKRTGEERTTPVLYTRHGDALVVVASKGGADQHPAWYLNLQAHPEARVEVGDRTLNVVARDAEGDERELLYARQTEEWPAFAEYRKKTARVIPVVVLEPSGS
ncbi:MAG: nitroreductase family deazaflavin-dependent oxidoreductase [Candidatus Dormibacteria bacterium]